MIESDDVTRSELGSTAVGARALTLVAALVAVLTLGLPWAQQERVKVVDHDPTLLSGAMQWMGWNLHAESSIDGQRPTAVAWVIILVGGSLLLLIGAWLAFERPRSGWIPKLMALLTVVLLLGSLVATRHLGSAVRSGDYRAITIGYGVAIWRIAVLAALFATVRLALTMERHRPDRA
ncbi:hypothetical protein ODJ79_43380 [Actinoplanes sp. KI2]|uniref:hypothetical protein n=1 Tax=Actinoplanes sp. KI2 TaxID=2983315 RepID=UPI0021D5A6C0|nr:hypothetical protein [Actinoplanes sp. KI2]MCU7730601.1 hypothetical protein [Actinoplanes sp. KI2]